MISACWAFCCRSIRSCSGGYQSKFIHAYFSMVRSNLEYCSLLWSPHNKIRYGRYRWYKEDLHDTTAIVSGTPAVYHLCSIISNENHWSQEDLRYSWLSSSKWCTTWLTYQQTTIWRHTHIFQQPLMPSNLVSFHALYLCWTLLYLAKFPMLISNIFDISQNFEHFAVCLEQWFSPHACRCFK